MGCPKSSGNALLLGETSGFKGNDKKDKSAKNSAKKSFAKTTAEAFPSTSKARQTKKQPTKFFGAQEKNEKKPFLHKSPEEKGRFEVSSYQRID